MHYLLVRITGVRINIVEAGYHGRGCGQNGSSGHNFRCHLCHEKGHFARNCPKKDTEKNTPEEGNMSAGREIYIPDFNPQLALEIGGKKDINLQDWWIDSGASQHMTPNKEELLHYQKFSKPVEINLADKCPVCLWCW